MGELGNIFEGTEARGGTKGPDVRVKADVPRAWLDRPDGVLIDVPDRVPFEGDTVPRRRGHDDPPGAVRMHLSAQLGERAMLRLRGQGGEHPESGIPGDLLVEITVVEGGDERRWWLVVVVVAAVAAAGAGAYALWGS